jgi:hypothetical protein
VQYFVPCKTRRYSSWLLLLLVDWLLVYHSRPESHVHRH